MYNNCIKDVEKKKNMFETLKQKKGENMFKALKEKKEQKSFNKLVETCKNLTSEKRTQLMKALKPSRFEWATLSPFECRDNIDMYIMRCPTAHNDTEVCMRFGKNGSNYCYSINGESAFTNENIGNLFYPFLWKREYWYITITTTPGYKNDEDIMDMIKGIKRQLTNCGTGGKVVIKTQRGLRLFN